MSSNLKLKDLAFPIFIEYLLMRSLGLANIYLLSSYSEDAVAAVGVSNQLVNFINMLFMFVTLGTAVIVSQNLGAGNRKEAATTSTMAILLNTCIGVGFGLFTILFHQPILTVMGLTGQVFDFTSTYFSILGGLCVLQGLNFSLGTIMRNYGQAKAPMLVFLGMSTLILTGNTIIVMRPWNLPDFGIQGIAIWTVFSQGMGLIAMIACAIRYKVRFRLHKPFPLATAKKILVIGVPGAGDNFAYSIAQIAMTYFVTSLGTTSLVTFSYATNLIAFVQLLGFSIGQGTQIIVGRYVGAHQFKSAYHFGFRSLRQAVILNVSVMLTLILFQRPILSIFTDNPQILSVIFWVFLIDLILEFGRPLNLVLGLCVRASGDVRWTIVVSCCSIIGVMIPLAFLFSQVLPLGVPGIFLALCADEWLRGLLMTWRWRSRRWEKAVIASPKSSEKVLA